MNHPKIKEQIELMRTALQIESDIETVKRLIGPVDSITTKVTVDELRCKYLDIMSLLFSNLLLTSNTVEQ